MIILLYSYVVIMHKLSLIDVFLDYHPSNWQPNGTLDDIRTSTLDYIGELNVILWNSTSIG